MCITVGGAKRSLRIGISQPTKGRRRFANLTINNSQGRQSFAEGLSPMIASASADKFPFPRQIHNPQHLQIFNYYGLRDSLLSVNRQRF
ncbi:MAG: hypothetical protein LBU34_09540 [Planctomycetaceae bacterium]|nr:hypothetical protein [Planctomycetaceae bacterium]